MGLAAVLSYGEIMAEKQAKKVVEKKCPACGRMFTPRQLGGGSRMYCYDPKCEMERDRERKRKYRAKKRKRRKADKKE